MEYIPVAAIAVVFAIYVIVKEYPAINQTESEPGTKRGNARRYAMKKSIMSRSESRFFKMLVDVAEDKYYVFPRVTLSALLDEKKVAQDPTLPARRINSKTVDYVLCDKTTLKSVYAVELDEKPSQQVDLYAKDVEVEQILESASIPLVRFSDYKKLNEEDIEQRFYEMHLSASRK